MGLEPTTLGTTIRCSNQLSYNVRIVFKNWNAKIDYFFKLQNLEILLKK